MPQSRSNHILSILGGPIFMLAFLYNVDAFAVRDQLRRTLHLHLRANASVHLVSRHTYTRQMMSLGVNMRHLSKYVKANSK